MRLSELKTGEKGVIVKVMGHGGFRKRIVEMGFIKNKTVEVILNAPLKDPVEYKILDYKVSLRRAEADLIEVVSEKEAETYEREPENQPGLEAVSPITEKIASERSKIIHVALVGNPNCGKTCIFNIASGAHERVGNYSGVTVDSKEGYFNFKGYKIKLVDLPGTYSLSAYTPEELYVRKYIVEKMPDIILNVVDSSNLERNLYLTTQLIDMDVPMVMALNMYDELEKSGNTLDHTQLGMLLGIPSVPTIGSTGKGIDSLFDMVVRVYNGENTVSRHIHVNHGKDLEKHIDEIEAVVRVNPEPNNNYSARFLSIKLLENDKQITDMLRQLPNGSDIIKVRDKAQEEILKELKEDSESALTDTKYGFIQGALREAFVYNGKDDNLKMTKSIDRVVTHRILGYPVFFLFIYLMFYLTFNIGVYPMDWIDSFMGWLGELIGNNMTDGPLKDLIVDGIIGGVGGVIVFLPNILILYACISFMEDSGYMARAAFIMDKIMHKMGLHGKSFIPMIMGFGCNIPAIMATRTIEDRKSRLITMLVLPLMSCSARLPVYIILIGAFFPAHAALILFSLYLFGIVMAILMARLFGSFLVKGESSPFVMELPPYRMPTVKAVFRHTWEKGKQYLYKMGTVILGASIIVWFLSYYPRLDESQVEASSNVGETQIENSYIGKIGKVIEPIIRPCGFHWKEGVSIITGIGAKEIVASTMGVLYSQTDGEMDEDSDESHLSQIIREYSGLTPLAAISFLVFVLLYMPCIPAIVTIKGESGRWRWALFTVAYTTGLAWICSTLIFQIGSLI